LSRPEGETGRVGEAKKSKRGVGKRKRFFIFFKLVALKKAGGNSIFF